LGENNFLEPYEVVKQIGFGEGRVYELIHKETKEHFVLKVLKK